MTDIIRQTKVTYTHGDQVVKVWTSQKKFINRMRADERYREVDSGTWSCSWVEFEIDADLWSPEHVKKRRNLTPEHRAAVAESMRKAQARRTELRRERERARTEAPPQHPFTPLQDMRVDDQTNTPPRPEM